MEFEGCPLPLEVFFASKLVPISAADVADSERAAAVGLYVGATYRTMQKCLGCSLTMISGSVSAPPDVCSRLQLNGTYIDAVLQDDGAGVCSRCRRLASDHFFASNPWCRNGERIGHCQNREFENYCCLCLSQIDCQRSFGKGMVLDTGGCEQCVQRNVSLRSKMLAFAMANHFRLGEDSNAKKLFEIMDGTNILRALVFESCMLVHDPLRQSEKKPSLTVATKLNPNAPHMLL